MKLFPESSDLPLYARSLKGDIPNRAIPFIWYFVKSLKGYYIFHFCVFFIALVLMALEPIFFGMSIDILSSDQSYDSKFNSLLMIIVAYIVLCQILSRLGWQLGHYTETKTRPLLRGIIQQKLSDYLSNHSTNFFQNEFAGRLSGKVLEMPSEAVSIVDDIMNPILFSFVNITIAIIVLSTIHISLGLTIIAYACLVSTAVYFAIPNITKKADIATSKTQATRGLFVDNVSNKILAKIFSRKIYESRRLSTALIANTKANSDEQKAYFFLWQKQHILNAFMQVIILILCLYLAINEKITVGQCATALTFGLMLISNGWWLLQVMTVFFSRFATIEDGLRTIIQPFEVKDIENAKSLKVKTAPPISIENIKKSYGDNIVFNNFSLNIEAKSKVGFIGRSGAGKSSLVNLLMRLFDVENGIIKIHGHDISMVTQESLRNNISFIPQDTSLFHRSLMDNIRYGRLGATDAEVIEAAKRAHAHDFISELSNGYDTMVGERGVKLSGGQRQRIAIARAILKDAPILILDEATSALDSESEKLIQDSLKDLMKGKTVIAIAHRLSTIAHLDRLIVMDKGQIIEDGTHDDLLKKDGHYAKLWAMQSGGFLQG